eukprot:6208133-Pleurochrysis_carterae.AAC.2
MSYNLGTQDKQRQNSMWQAMHREVALSLRCRAAIRERREAAGCMSASYICLRLELRTCEPHKRQTSFATSESLSQSLTSLGSPPEPLPLPSQNSE